MTGDKMSAVILASDRGPGDPLALGAGVDSKSLVPVAGMPMLERVVRALEASRFIGRILILHNIEDLPQALPVLGPWLRSGRVALEAAQASPAASTLHAVTALAPTMPVLVTTSDHALLTTAMVDHFCDVCRRTGADICAAVTSAAVIQSKYPTTRRTYLKFRGGAYSGSNLFAFMTPASVAAAEFWHRVEGQRKQPWRLARLFGPWLLIGYLLRLWPLDVALAKAGRRLRITAAAVVMPFAEAAIDVDRPDDLALANTILGQRQP